MRRARMYPNVAIAFTLLVSLGYGLRADTATLVDADASYRAANLAEQRGHSNSVDYYFQAVMQTWDHCQPAAASQPTAPTVQRAWQLYHWSLAGLIRTGQQHGRFSPSRGLLVNTAVGAGVVSVAYTGFPWSPDDFARLVVVNPYQPRKLLTDYRQAGFGLPLVALCERPSNGPFMARRVPFAVTALLQPNGAPESQIRLEKTASHTVYASGPPATDLPIVATLHLLDPLRIDSVQVNTWKIPVTRDLSAALAATQQLATDNPITAFVRPGQPNEHHGLKMIEPYQPGKIPLVLIHGLASNRLTWVNLANELRVVPWINDRYQIWYFQYPTGEPFLRSAATLRRLLYQVAASYDPTGADRMLAQTVLVGHSMGGLVSKMQVTYSQTTIWDRVAYRPLHELRMSAEMRRDLQELFYFQPMPNVKRVVFIGTPHRGSSWATRLVGQFASSMVTPSPERAFEHQQLVRSNPTAFIPSMRRRIPTSVDLLQPNSPLLAAMATLPFHPQVRLHSIIGTGTSTIMEGPSDGVVPVSSARHPGVVSEHFVNAGHAELPHVQPTIDELVRILRLHVQEADSTRQF